VSQAITRTQLLQYSVLALPLAFAGLPVYLLAPDFYATSYQVSLASLGISLLVLRLFDALIDPLLGYVIDYWAQYFNLLIRLGIVILAVGLLMLFWVPDFGPGLLLIWFSIAVFVTTLAYSLLTIGYGVQGAIWSPDREEQVSITTTREAFTLIGLILAVTLPTLLTIKFTTIDAHRVLAVLLVICLILAFNVYAKLKTPKPDQGQVLSRNPGQAIRTLLSPALIRLYLIYGVSALASAIPAVLVIFFVRDYLGAYKLIGIFLLAYFLSGALSMPVWRQLASKVGKLHAWMISMLLALSAFTLVLLCQPGDLVFYAAICLITGFALGAELALPPALLAELIDRDISSVGLKYAGLTCLNKISLALAAGISLPLLSMMGFQPGQENSTDALNSLLWIYGGLPCALKLCALAGASFWKNHLHQGSYA